MIEGSWTDLFMYFDVEDWENFNDFFDSEDFNEFLHEVNRGVWDTFFDGIGEESTRNFVMSWNQE